MKKIVSITLISALVFACSRKTTPTSEIIISNQPSEKKTTEVAATPKTEAPAGQTVYTTRCGRCHGLKPVENYTAQAWENILKSMIPKAKLTETEARDVTAYVMTHAKK